MAGSHEPALDNIWTQEVPRMALSHDVLLHAVMALSCLYLIVTDNDGNLELQTHRASYLEATVQKHRDNVANMTQENADVACFVSVLLTIDTYASLRFRPLELYEPPTQWLQMCRGLGGVFREAMTLLRNDPAAKMRPLTEASSTVFKADVVFSPANREGLGHLLDFDDGELYNESERKALEDVVSYIGSVMRGRKAHEHPKTIARRLTSFPVVLPAQ